jgi:hypothetical protein
LYTNNIPIITKKNEELISNNSIGTICPSKIENKKSEYLLRNTKRLKKGNILA